LKVTLARAENNFGLRNLFGTIMRVRAASKALSQQTLKDVLRRRWACCIMKRLGEHGTLHFGALKRTIPGISNKVLTERLRHLEETNLLRREPKATPRPQVFYSLTARGQKLKGVLDRLSALGAREK